MAVMDMLESSNAANSGRVEKHPNKENMGRGPRFGVSSTKYSAFESDLIPGLPRGLIPTSAATSSPTPATAATTSKRGRLLSVGPTPKKGSGQDRFRQMMKRAPSQVTIGNNKNNMPPRSASGNQAVAGIPSHPMNIGASHYSPGPTVAASFGMRSAIPYPDLGRVASMPTQVKAKEVEAIKRTGNGNDNGYGYGSGGNGGKVGGDTRNTAVRTAAAILSGECQKRGFNPQFHGWITREGDFKCSITLKHGKTVHDDRTFKTAVDAKQALAKRAVEEVRKLPLPEPKPVEKGKLPLPEPKPVEKGKLPLPEPKLVEKGKSDAANERSGYDPPKKEPTPVKREERNNRSAPTASFVPAPVPVKREERERRYAPVASVVPEPTASFYKPEYNRREELRFLIDCVESLCGAANGPSPRILEDPLASRAFLEGFALGGRLEDSARREYVEYAHPRRTPAEMQRLYTGRFYRHRERSPGPTYGGHAHRERSPLRRRVSFNA
ncbi:hypothetical protein F4779DRAFT_644095 [Xylariaceae sp. FL0662B]|nr:hypothetical protein F4779DRAFT_644095 [Xylariaceae sp. FL0662B]